MTEKKDEVGLLERVFGEPSDVALKKRGREIGLGLTALLHDGVGALRHELESHDSALLPVRPWTQMHYRAEWDWEREGGISAVVALEDLEPNRELTERLARLFSTNRNLDLFFLLTQGAAIFRRRDDAFFFLPGGTLPSLKGLGEEAREALLSETYEPFFAPSPNETGVFKSLGLLLSPPPLPLEVEVRGARLTLELSLRLSPLLVDEVARVASYPVLVGLSVERSGGKFIGMAAVGELLREREFWERLSEELLKTFGLWLLRPPDGEEGESSAFLAGRREPPASEWVLIEVPARRAESLKALDTESIALALLVSHPDWSVAKIAEELGCDRKTPYKWPRFKQALSARRAARRRLPRGQKSKWGEIEAWRD